MNLPEKKILNILALYSFSSGKKNTTEPTKKVFPFCSAELGVG